MDEDVEAVMRKYEGRLLSLPNVTGVGIGEKEGRSVILVFVSRKIPKSELSPESRIPESLDGFETEVELQIVVGRPESFRRPPGLPPEEGGAGQASEDRGHLRSAEEGHGNQQTELNKVD